MNDSSLPLVSVVTPVYNGEKYLSQCIESVLVQTYCNWEYIIVDNCSTDRSSEIIKNYAKREARILYFKNKNFVSVIDNHQIAYRLISLQSKYCKVVHADDWLFSECLEKMVDIGEKNPSVGIIGAYRLNDKIVDLDGLPYPSHSSVGRDIGKKSLLEEIFVFGSPSSLLIRTDIIRNKDPFYDEENFMLQADTGACYDVLRKWDFGFVHQVLTYTRRHDESQSSGVQKINSYRLAHLMALKKYGHSYLETNDYERVFKKAVKDYYKYLTKSIFKKKDKDFWKYHKKRMARLEIPFSKATIIRNIFFDIIEIIFNQKKMIYLFYNGIKRFINKYKL